MAKTETRSGSITTNRKANFDYFIEETVEAGIALTGSEIKSIRAGKVNLRDSYARVERGEVWLLNCHISPYEQTGSYFNHNPLRPRKLLLHRDEIQYLAGKVEAKGYSLVPLSLYLSRGRAKISLALAKGKHNYDKRQTMAKRDAEREIEQAMKRSR